MPELERILIVPDTHIPGHDRRAWKLMLKAGRAFKPDVLIHLGDLMDFFAISSYSKDPRRSVLLKDELVEVRKGRADLDALGAKRKVMLGSNHGDRLQRYLMDKAPELFGLIDEPQLLDLYDNGWEWIPYKETFQLGKVHWVHDIGLSGKNATARTLEQMQHSVVCGHNHAMQYVIQGSALGEHQVGFQPGWLGDVNQVEYMARAKANRMWALGFGVGYHHVRSGVIHLVPCPIVNYAVVLEGKRYTA